MAFENIRVKNYMEEVVNMHIESVLEEMNVCKCKKCLMDITAMTLNQLPPKYIVTRKGELYSRINTLSNQFEVDIIAAITKAAILVKRHPRHDEDME